MQHFVKARIVFIIKDGHVDRNCHYYLMYQTQWDVFARGKKRTHLAKGFCLDSSPIFRRSIPAVCSHANLLKTNRPIFMILRVLLI